MNRLLVTKEGMEKMGEGLREHARSVNLVPHVQEISGVGEFPADAVALLYQEEAGSPFQGEAEECYHNTLGYCALHDGKPCVRVCEDFETEEMVKVQMGMERPCSECVDEGKKTETYCGACRNSGKSLWVGKGEIPERE